MTRVDPSRGDHSWNDRSDDERRDITGWAKSQPVSTLVQVAPEMLRGGPTQGGAVASNHVGSSAGTGPGTTGVVGAGAGNGPGSVAVVGEGVLAPKMKPTFTQLSLGRTGWSHDPDWSDTEEWEARYGEPGDWLGGIVTMGVDLGHNARRVFDQYSAYVQEQPPVRGGSGWERSGAADWWEQANSPWGPDHPIWGFDGGGF